jgi:3-dehydroquinate synthase
VPDGETLVIQSHRGPYAVRFEDDIAAGIGTLPPETTHVIIDDRVAGLYRSELAGALELPSVLRIEAREPSKSLDRFPAYVSHLVEHTIRRDHTLVAIGGGIVQDITCFLAATMLRGVAWRFFPTTLLAQADSCIGSKSSINAGAAKNILGTFTPPQEIVISTRFLETLDERDVRSGIGEILKVHAIEGPEAFDGIARDYSRLSNDAGMIRRYIRRALEIKQRYIEIDEFDRGARNIFNYGHSFGHAIETATEFAVPHGIAVTIGMDMANFVAMRSGIADEEVFRRMHPTLKTNFRGFETHPVPPEPFFLALAKDKKNVGADLTLILPDGKAALAKRIFPNDQAFRAMCVEYLEHGRAS